VSVAIGIASPWLGALPVRAIPAVVAMAAGAKAGQGPQPPGELTLILGDTPSLEALLAALVIAGGIGFALALIATRQAAALGARALIDLRDAALGRALSRPPDWLREAGRGAQAKNALIAQCRVVSAYATGTVPAAVGVVSAVFIWSQALGAAVGGGAAAGVVAAVVGTLIVVNLGAVWLTAKKSESAQKAVMAETSAFVVAVNESIDHIATLQLAAARDAQRARARAIAARMARNEVKVATWSGLSSAASGGLTLLAIPLLVVAWRQLGLEGASLAVMIPALLMLQRAVAGLGSLWTSYKVSRPSIDLIADVMAPEPHIGDGGARPAVKGAVGFRGIRWTLGERVVLDGVDLDVAPGEAVAIVGAGGCGKSTLLRMAARLVAPTAGAVTLDGADVTTLDVDHLRRRVAMLEQHPALFDRTLRDNLVLDDRAVDAARLDEVVRATQLDEVVARLPAGLDQKLAGGGALSGSERRRVALARVLLADPDVLLIDELEAGLPQAQAESLLAAVRAATAGKTCLLVTHRPDLLRVDRVAFLAGGRIVDQGAHADLVARNEAYRSLLSSKEPHE
jgi:ATP-binding cassette subfamily B protein